MTNFQFELRVHELWTLHKNAKQVLALLYSPQFAASHEQICKLAYNWQELPICLEHLESWLQQSTCDLSSAFGILIDIVGKSPHLEDWALWNKLDAIKSIQSERTHPFPEKLFDRLTDIKKSYQQKIEEQFEQLTVLRNQQLFREEKSLLENLKKTFPNEPRFSQYEKVSDQQSAFDLIDDKHSGLTFREEPDTLPYADLRTFWSQQKKVLLYDILIACMMVSDFESAVYFLKNPPKIKSKSKKPKENPTLSLFWLEAEIYLAAERHVELLDWVSVHESQHTSTDNYYAFAFFKACAYWGLGQKQTAQDILTALSSSRPEYRASLELLEEWKSL